MNYKTSGILFLVSGILFLGAAWMGSNRTFYVVSFTFIVLGIAFLFMFKNSYGSKDEDTNARSPAFKND